MQLDLPFREAVLSKPETQGASEEAMSPDTQEARSRIHDPRGLKIIRLRSGAWGLSDQWGRDCGLAPPGGLELAVVRLFMQHSFAMPWPHGALSGSPGKPASAPSSTTKSAEELGL